MGPSAVSAATTPSLGAAATYGVVSDTFTNSNTAPYTIINGTVGQPALCYTTLSTVGPTSQTGTTVTPCDAAVALAQGNAKADVNLQASLPGCTNLGGGAVTLNSFDLDGAGPILPGHYPPGCYTNGGAMIITLGTSITLDGNGTHIFKPGGSLTTGDDSFVALAGGASACDVFWAPVGDTTIGAYTGALPNPNAFVGTIFRGDAAGLSITLGHFQSLLGRALAFGSTVTTDANTITTPSCAAPPPSGGSSGTINVVKRVINDNGRTKTIADFALFVNGTPVSSGLTNSFPAPAGVYTVTETSDANYATTFSGDCDVNGRLNLNPGDNKFCIITNNDIGAPVVVPPVPPLIDVVKVPSPLSLPAGPGQVTYTYTARNIGTVPMTDVTLVGDTCSPIVRVSGDTNGDNRLDVNETWVHTCTTTLTATHTNTVVATGWANGLSATDIASATVVVGVPLVPPLIHVTKVPSPLTLLAAGGLVTYTERITNPGTVALANVTLTDDKCSPMARISGDTNGNGMLETTETWTYTCTTGLTATTTNTATATGTANGFTVRDFAIATVVVAAAVAPTPVPALPNAGSGPANGPAWPIVAGIAVAGVLSIIRKKRTA
ncbi:MAG TPA: ice-binding family protein [Candidatus Eisenbacteria bacterium]|nr:ice-binding family protein [Candidatus Eisenbacteria bacterium]